MRRLKEINKTTSARYPTFKTCNYTKILDITSASGCGLCFDPLSDPNSDFIKLKGYTLIDLRNT